MGIQNQVVNKHESVAVGRQMGLNYVQCTVCQKLKKLKIYHSNHTRSCGVNSKCNKYSKQAQITLK